MKRILNIMGLDMTNALRDNIIIYMIIAPLLMAFAVRIFFPSFEAAGLNIAVEQEAGQELILALEQYGKVEVMENADAVRTRVRRPDALPGVIVIDGEPALLFEGNEPEATVQSYTAILERALSGQDLLTLTHKNISTSRSLLYEYLIIMVLMMTIFLGAVVPGFNLIHEKETKAVKALNISPMTLADYLAARGVLAVSIGLVTAVLVTLILAGTAVNYWLLMAALLVSALLTTLLTLLVGTFADNQISAIAVLKIIMPVYLALPLIAMFIPEKFQFLFWILPNYWQFQMLKTVILGAGEPFWLSAALTLSLSIAFLAALTPTLKNRLTLR